MMKSAIFDLRNPEAWTKAQRQRKPDRAIVGNRWTYNPFGEAPVEVYASVQPGILYWDGQPANATGYNGKLAARLLAIPESGLICGDPLLIWGSADGRQKLFAFDITNLAVIEAWIEEIRLSLSWANGFHFDYFTSLSWLRPGPYDAGYWRSWDTGYALATTLLWQNLRYRTLGGQYHETPITPYVDGLFYEEHPQHFGILMENQNPRPGSTYEIRWGDQIPPELAGRVTEDAWIAYVDTCLRWIKEKECYVSWRRDADSMVGLDVAMARAGV